VIIRTPSRKSQERRVTGFQNRSFHRRRIKTDLTAGFNASLGGGLDNNRVNFLPGSAGNLYDIILQRLEYGILTQFQAGKGAEGLRVFQIKGQFSVIKLPILLQQRNAQNLLRGHAGSAGINRLSLVKSA